MDLRNRTVKTPSLFGGIGVGGYSISVATQYQVTGEDLEGSFS
jgi:hypothetical protein